jgi:hypothetical protein
LNVIPALVTQIGGGKAGQIATIGAKVAKEVIGTDDPKAVQEALRDPKTAEEFKYALEIALKREEIVIEDVQDARRATFNLAQAGSSISWGAPVISVIIVLGYFLCTYTLFFQAAEIPSNVFNLLNVMFGTLTAAFLAVVNYWLGSSSGSKRAGDVVRQIAETTVKRTGS